MGYNDFHKGFKQASSPSFNTVVRKKSFGPRSLDDIVKSRFEKRGDNTLPIQSVVQRQSTDYQQNIKAQRNLRNLDK